MRNFKALLILVITGVALGFAYVTLESVAIDGKQVHFCREIEIWCYQEKDGYKVVYNEKDDKYTLGYYLHYTNITVSDGKFDYRDDELAPINLADGKYNDVYGDFLYNESIDDYQFTVLSEDEKIIGNRI